MLSKFRNMTKWGILIIVAVFIIAIFADWGGKMTGLSITPYAMKINGEKILFDQIDGIESSRMENKSDLTDTDRRKIYSGVLDDIVREHLSLEAAQKIGMLATEQEVVTQTRDRLFRNEQGQLEAERYKRARREVSSAEWSHYEDMIRNDITLWKIFNFVTGGIEVTPAELRDYFNLRYQRATLSHILIRPGDFVPIEKAKTYYETHPDSFMIDERIKGRHILFPVRNNMTPAEKLEVRSRAEALLIRLQSGEKFGNIFSSALKDTSGAVIAQELDWFQKGQMVPEFETVAFHWPVNAPTKIIETQFGYHVAYFDAHEARHRQSFDDVSDGLKAALAGDSEINKAKRLIEDIAKRIKNGESFEELARKYSSAKSGARGGLVGNVIPGEMTSDLYPDTNTLKMVGLEMGTLGENGKVYIDPEINRVIFDLEASKISDVIVSSHGFHIVRLEARKPADPKVWETQIFSVENEYREFLKNQIYQDWITELRKKANIEYTESIRKRLE